MTYDQLVTLDNIIKHGSFKMASASMFKSQPSLSMAIKKLEEEFGIIIFNRDGYRPVLTEDGKKFYRKSQIALNHFNELENLAKNMGAQIETEINICIEAVFPLKFISKKLSNFFEINSMTSLNLNIDVLEGLQKRLNNHEVDFAIGPDFNLSEDIESIKLIDINMIPVIGKRHFKKSINNIDYLKTIPQIVVKSSSKNDHENITDKISNQLWNTSDLFMKEQLISSDLGWGRLPSHQIRHKIDQKELFEISGIPQVSSRVISMFLLRHKTKTMGPKTKELWLELSNMSNV